MSSLSLKEKKLLALFDMVYQGFGSGTLDGDAAGVRQFAKDGNNIIISYSFAKNMGLYGEEKTVVYSETCLRQPPVDQ